MSAFRLCHYGLTWIWRSIFRTEIRKVDRAVWITHLRYRYWISYYFEWKSVRQTMWWVKYYKDWQFSCQGKIAGSQTDDGNGKDKAEIRTRCLIQFFLWLIRRKHLWGYRWVHPDYGDNKIDTSTFLDPYWDNDQEGRYWKEDYYENNDDDC